MASSDSPERQKAHAEQMRTERTIMRDLGTTREGARAVLSDQARRMREQAAERAKAAGPNNEPAPKPTAPTITSETSSFEPRPLTLGDSGTRRPPTSDSSQSGDFVLLEDVAYLKFDDDTIHITSIWTDGSDSVLP